QGCALLRKKFKEDLFTSCKHRILQDSSEPSNDNTNVVNAPREPFVGNQDLSIFCRQCTCELCGNGAHYGYNCPPKVPIIPNPEPFNNQTIKELPPAVQSFYPKFDLVHDSPNVFNPPPQLPFISCEFCGNDAHFQQQDLCCENYGVTHEAYQCQPKIEDYYHEQNSCHDSNSFSFDQFQPQQYTVNHPIFNVQNDLFDSQNKLMEQLTSMCDMVGQFIQKKEEEKQIEEEQIPACYDDDDDDYAFAIIPNEPVNSLSIGDEHLNTIPATKSDEFIKSSVENLFPIPSESEGENECDMLVCEAFITFSNILFDAENDFYSSDDQSLSDEDLPKEIYSNPDSLMEEYDLSFTLDYPMPPGIEDGDYDSERDILILEDLLSNDSLSLLKNESFYFDIPSSFHPPAKPPDGNTGLLNVKKMGDNSEQKFPMPRLVITRIPN
nr:hypothetical protein [Tanacetum cinerariifolium]